MKKMILGGMLAALSLSFSMTASACDFQNTTPIKSLTAGFEAWKVVTATMSECGNFSAELDQEFRKKQPEAFAAKPALYHIGGVANATLIPLLDAGTIRPLDGLVKKYGKHLKPNQLIKHDGKIVAIAMMVNNQHLMYRSDIFEDLDITPPKTYAALLKAAKKIKASGKVDYPLGGTYKTGWNLAEEFVNIYMGYGGNFIGKRNQATVNNKSGVKTLQLMKKLTAYMDPEYLVSDSTYVQKQMQQGKIAMTNLWQSRAAAMNDEKESTVVGKVATSAAPSAKRGGRPATTLWWDGIVIAKNITDQEAEAAFRLAMHGLSKDMVQKNNDVAVWIIDGYQPNELSKGAIDSANAGAPGYPASSGMSLMHTALGNNVADYLTGKKSERDTLKAIAKAYNTAAKEKGLMK